MLGYVCDITEAKTYELSIEKTRQWIQTRPAEVKEMAEADYHCTLRNSHARYIMELIIEALNSEDPAQKLHEYYCALLFNESIIEKYYYFMREIEAYKTVVAAADGEEVDAKNMKKAIHSLAYINGFSEEVQRWIIEDAVNNYKETKSC